MISRKRLMLSTLFAAVAPAVQANQQAPTKPDQNPPNNKPKDPQSFEPRTGPGAGQKLMERYAGDWDVVKTISPPGKDPVRTTGTCKQRMIHNGRFLRSEFVFNEKDGTQTTGEGILGFDAAKGVFSSVWTDSRSTRISLRQSEGQFDGETIALFGRVLEGGPDTRHSRTVAHLEDSDRKLIHRQFNPGPDGKEYQIMELALTRKEGSSVPATKPAQDKRTV